MTVTAPRVLVAGIGNIFFGDDAFGVEVARRLASRSLPEGVKVVDYGIRGVHLAYELLDGYDALVLVDALAMGEAAGTVAVVEPEIDLDEQDDAGPPLEAHSMSPAVVLGLIRSLGGNVDRVVIVGCEPAVLDDGIGLSPVVAAAVNAGVAAVVEVVDDLRLVARREC